MEIGKIPKQELSAFGATLWEGFPTPILGSWDRGWKPLPQTIYLNSETGISS